MKTILLSITVCALSILTASAENDNAKPGDAAQAAPAEYHGKAPNGLKTLAEHRVIAEFTGAPYRQCQFNQRSACPDRCPHAGEFATFAIKHYLHYAKPGKYGDARQDTYSRRISDFHKKPAGDEQFNALIASLKKGDLVILEWKHLYGEVRPGADAPVRPLLRVKKVSKKEAAALIAKAEAKEK